ncbi:MAG: dihydrodipicolinate synthase family protein [Trueperaceae bacterium]
MQVNFEGVIPAITTPFNEDLGIDHALQAEHANWMVDAGCTGVVPFGSLGEAATLTYSEKLETVASLAEALQSKAPVIPMVSSLSTAEAARFARDAQAAGASGFMVLPPYVYSSDWREMKGHVSEVLAATDLPCMLYNNPLAYKTDFLPPQVAELAAEYPHLQAIKESSADLRRITWLRTLMGEDFKILIGVDDLIVEAIGAGAVGWIAGLVNAMPAESVRLFELARAGRDQDAFELYSWFLPLLRLDIGTKFVQMIKLAVEYAGWGSSRVRAPRYALQGAELAAVMRTIEAGFASRPDPAAWS